MPPKSRPFDWKGWGSAPQHGFLGSSFKKRPTPAQLLATKERQRQYEAQQVLQKQEHERWDADEVNLRKNRNQVPRQMWSESLSQFRTATANWMTMHGVLPEEERRLREQEDKHLKGHQGGPMDAHVRVHFDDQVAGIDKYKGAHMKRGYGGYKR